ncbi:MAG: hypothetical protein NVS2B16_33010 [Chloroflexota bacterium]
MKRGLRVTHFDVWKDVKVEGLYFIRLKRGDGSSAGALAYRIGWAKPATLVRLTRRLGAAPAPAHVARAFRVDPQRLEASFTSTFPT